MSFLRARRKTCTYSDDHEPYCVIVFIHTYEYTAYFTATRDYDSAEQVRGK